MSLTDPEPGKTSAGLYFLDPNPKGREPVLLMHGLGADCESWPFQIYALTKAGCRPIAIDLPGFGKSPAYPRRWTVARTARAVCEFIHSLGLDRVHLAGISMGGTVALEMALKYPESVGRLILINTFARLKAASPQQALYFMRRFFLVNSGSRREQAQYVAWRIFPEIDQQGLRDILEVKILEADPRVYREAMISLAIFREVRRLGRIKSPTLVISGEKDTTVALANQSEMAAAIPDARQVIISGGGHGVTADHPEMVNTAILEFLNKEKSAEKGNGC